MAPKLSLAAALGLGRSLLMYYAIPGRGRAWREFYKGSIHPGELCFDIGAHVGNRSGALLDIGARVVAVEPQPWCNRILQRLYGARGEFSLVKGAVGAQAGRAELMISARNPTVSTMSAAWAVEVSATRGFSGTEWNQQISVPVRTLDDLNQ